MIFGLFFKDLPFLWPGGSLRAVVAPKLHFVGFEAWSDVFVGDQKSEMLNFLGAPSRQGGMFSDPRRLRMSWWMLWSRKFLLPKWLGVVSQRAFGNIRDLKTAFFLGILDTDLKHLKTT